MEIRVWEVFAMFWRQPLISWIRTTLSEHELASGCRTKGISKLAMQIAVGCVFYFAQIIKSLLLLRTPREFLSVFTE